MFQFVYWLRAIAAVMITNAHYADIWPVSALAFGGHFGNCIYFFLSGFCLYNIREPIYKWYFKRIIRIYPSLWIVSALNLLLNNGSIDTGITGYIHCFLYPTWYHFIASIMLLYLAFYALRFLQSKFKIDTRIVAALLFAVFLAVYVFAFDKSYYHIDDVNEKWCRFMFAESMLFGAISREKYSEISEKISPFHVVSIIALGISYFIMKKAVSNISALAPIQFVMPVLVASFIFSVALLFIKLEKRGFFEKINRYVKGVVKFTADISFEIYLCQNIIILYFAKKFAFPINFVVVTALIIVYAFLVNKAANLLRYPFKKVLKSSKNAEVHK